MKEGGREGGREGEGRGERGKGRKEKEAIRKRGERGETEKRKSRGKREVYAVMWHRPFTSILPHHSHHVSGIEEQEVLHIHVNDCSQLIDPVIHVNCPHSAMHTRQEDEDYHRLPSCVTVKNKGFLTFF